MPLLNVLASTCDTAPVVIKVHGCSRYIMGGGKKDAEYIAKIFLAEMQRLDPEKNRFDIFIIDGDSNIQGTVAVVEAVFPLYYTIHGAENVLDIVFEDISKIPEIKVSDLFDASSLFLYNFLFLPFTLPIFFCRL